MKKIDMIMTMINDGYINEDRYSGGCKRNKRERAIHTLQYHILKEDIEKMYNNYLTYKATCAIM